jgi:MFS transporter, DHA2 family, multidrug resistance protein
VLMIQGVAFSCLFIPLTTLALSSIPRHRLADATGLNSLLRQVGGSIGLAIFATLLTRNATRARETMLPNLSISNPAMAARVSGMSRMLSSHGYDAVATDAGSVRIVDMLVRQQGMVLSFEKMFLLAGICFLCVLPLVLVLKAPKHTGGEKIEVHIEM